MSRMRELSIVLQCTDPEPRGRGLKSPFVLQKRHFHRICEHVLARMETKIMVSGSEDLCRGHRLEGFTRKKEEWELEDIGLWDFGRQGNEEMQEPELYCGS